LYIIVNFATEINIKYNIKPICIMSDLAKFGQMAAQEVGQRAIQSVVKNPQAAVATGIAAAKTIGGAIVIAAPYVAAIAVGGAIGYGVAWGLDKIFGD
jgi:hypothetical protein